MGTYGAKPLGLVSFAAKSWILKCRFPLVWTRKSAVYVREQHVGGIVACQRLPTPTRAGLSRRRGVFRYREASMRHVTEKAFLCGRSQSPAGYCYNLRNLAFQIEPRSSLIRPTLRDGH